MGHARSGLTQEIRPPAQEGTGSRIVLFLGSGQRSADCIVSQQYE